MSDWKTNPPPTPSATSAHPNWGIITGVHIPSPDTVDGRTVSTTPGVTYDLVIYTESGPVSFDGVSPSQNRYDCWFYPSPENSIADVYWEEAKMHFRVLEIPATEDC